MGNQRVFYACQGICFNNEPVEGVQSVTLDTQQDIINVDQFGTMKVHGVVPNYPRINISLSRVLSTGTVPLYSGTLQDNINNHTHTMCLFIGEDTANRLHASDTSNSYNIFLSGISINTVGYEFGVDGNFVENLQLIGYNKFFNECPVDNTAFTALSSGSTAFRRQHFDIESSTIASGMLPSGARIQSISIDSNFNINTIDEFGMNVSNPSVQYRYATLPIETNCSVEVILDGAGLDFYEIDPVNGVTHLCEFTGLSKLVPLSFNLCGGLNINLGSGMLSSVNYGGGDTGGGNVTATLNFTSLNKLTIN